MTEITEDRDFKTNINVESQTIKYALNPSQFKEDLQIAIIEGRATGRTVVKTIDNVINGDKSQDIGDAERRSLIEIKEAIVRVQTAPAMDIIAEKDLADKNIQARLGVEIEKFDPNDPALSEKVKERIDELKSEGKELVAFYDKVTKKIFINQNAKDEEVRASIAREYKIKEDLELGRGKENDKGQLRSTVAGEIAYDEIKDRLKKGDKNPISASSFDVAKMDKDSEVTSDKYGEQVEGIGNIAADAMELSVITSVVDMNPGMLDNDPKIGNKLEKSGKKFVERVHKNTDDMVEGWHRPEYAEKEMLALEEKIAKEKNSEMKNILTARYNYLEQEAHPIRSIKEGFVSGFKEGSADAITLYAASKIPVFGKYVTVGTIIYGGVKHATNAAKEEPKIAITFTQANDIKRIAPEFYKDAESSFIIGNKSDVSNSVLIGAAEYYYKNNKTPDKRLGNSTGYLAGGFVAYKGISIAKSKYNSLKTSTSAPSLVSANKITNEEQLLLENKVNSVQGKVLINDGTPGGTTIAYQKRITYPDGSMSISQKNLTISKVSYQTGNNSLVLYDKTPVPVATNGALVPPLTTNKALATVPLVTNGTVSQVASKVGQVQNNRLPYKPVLALPVKYPIKSESGVTIYKDYTIGSRGAKYIEVGVSNNKEIVYKNSNGSYFKLTDNGLENISSKDVIKKEYFPTVKVQKNNGSNPSAGKNYYVSKKGNFKVEKYIEAGQTVEDYDKIYLIENVRARGINVGRSKEHTNTTISHWEKAVDIADEAKVDPNVKAVYVDETLKNISDKFKDSDARPDVTIEYKDGTFKLIEVQSKTDTEDDLTNKLKNIQDKYGEDVITNYKVEKPKGGK